MIWLVAAVVTVCATFSGTYISTGDIWTAAFAGGIPALLYMTGLAVHATCTTASLRCRAAVILVAVVFLSGISAEFMVLSSHTRWQADQMVISGEVIDRGILMTSLFDAASPAFVSFQQQSQRHKRPVGEVFKAAWDNRDWTAEVVRLESPSERITIFASPNPDGSVWLTGVALVTKGGDPNFANVNGTSGFLQSRLCLSSRGMNYEIEN